jgi:hypothetical protein
MIKRTSFGSRHINVPILAAERQFLLEKQILDKPCRNLKTNSSQTRRTEFGTEVNLSKEEKSASRGCTTFTDLKHNCNGDEGAND